ncbi:MAG TPA: CusA/CzcA family heavy metal efflux RND transporter [Chitinophagales bacterium]|nr:CusA/CzcA family heavy metal efflux RND transporter [Chitinophagales bacterium]
MNKFIKGVISFSLKNKFFIFSMTLVAVAAGIWSYLNTPLEAFPDVTNTQIVIITQWPGRSAEEVEKFITIPIETEMNSVQKKTNLRSISLFGLSVITIIFDDNIDDAFARQQVMSRMGDVDLPEGVTPDLQPPTAPTGEIYRYTLESKKRSSRELKTLQDWIVERQIKSVPGVADVVSFGGEVKDYEITADPYLLKKYDLSALDLFQAVSKSNLNVGGDVIEKSGQAYVVRGIGLLNNIDEIENVVITNINGTPILVKNVATVTESAVPRLGQVGRDNNPDVVEGIVLLRKGENPGAVLEKLKAKIDEINTVFLPSDTKIVAFYDRTNLIEFCTHTILHNLTEGILLVTFIVLIFMADWRTTFIVSIIIPLALLFAFICLRLKGMNANLLSMGAVDFGIIIDGAVVMVEGIFVTLDHLYQKEGAEKFNKLAKLGLIRKTSTQMGKAIFFAKIIILTCLMPIFMFQKVEGKMFSPLAYTLGFALLGALIFTLTLVPALASVLLKKDVKEKHNPIVIFITKTYMAMFRFTYRNLYWSLGVTAFVLLICFGLGKFLGTEFLPELNEGSIYVRASCPMSISLQQSVELTQKIRKIFRTYPEVRQVLSQTGRPNDGTDATGFYNIEFFVDIYPKEEWKEKISKEQLVDEMQGRFEKSFPGIDFNFSQPIMDNVEEAVSGVKGSIAAKIYGYDLRLLQKYADTVYAQLKTVKGIEDLGIIRNIGQPELQINFDQSKMAFYGISTEEAESVVEMAIGGKAATTIYEGERKFDLRIRYEQKYRSDEEDIGNLLVPTLKGNKIPIKEIAEIKTITGPSLIFREENQRLSAVKFSVRGRDMGSAVQEGIAKVKKAVHLPQGYKIQWKGDFENQIRATQGLERTVPIALLVVFIVLFITFGNLKDVLLVLCNVPFAVAGGIIALLVTHTNFSISAGIGFIALFGVCIQNGVILVSVFKHNIDEDMELKDAIMKGVESRVRPVVMTALMAALGLLPAAISTGIGSETQKPLAIVVIGGIITATFLTLLILPLLFEVVYRRTGRIKVKEHQY